MHKWSAGVRARVNSGKPYTQMLAPTARCLSGSTYIDCAGEASSGFSHWQANYEQKNSSRLPVFYQLDLRFDREYLFNTWKMTTYFDILNFLNFKNVTGYDYGDSYENYNNPKKVTSLGLFPSFGLEIEI